MELRDYLRTFQRGWKWIVASVLMVLAASIIFSLALTPQYTSESSLYASVDVETSTTGDLLQGAAFTREMIPSYVDLVSTAAVLQPVIDELGLTDSVLDIASGISASSPLGTVLLTITVTNSDPQKAADIANATGESLAKVVQQDLGNTGTSPVILTISQPAVAASSPSSPNYVFNLGAGLAIGLVVGVVIAFLRNLFETRVRSIKDIRPLLDAPVLGMIPTDHSVSRHPTFVHSDPESSGSEAIRRLRTNIVVLMQEDPRPLVVVSDTAGSGKSITALNLAISLAELGSQVVLVDADLRTPKVAQYMGLGVGPGLGDYLSGLNSIEDVTRNWESTSLDVVGGSAPSPLSGALLSSVKMEVLLIDLAQKYDYVLVDSSPNMDGTDAAVLASKPVHVLCVVANGRSSRRQFAAFVESLRLVRAQIAGLVVTMVRPNAPEYEEVLEETAS